jgi:hypothetical protein
MKPAWQDAKLALRMLKKSPAFTAVAVLTLDLGVGANTAIFRVMDAVLRHPFPYPDPGRLLASNTVNRNFAGKDRVDGARANWLLEKGWRK